LSEPLEALYLAGKIRGSGFDAQSIERLARHV
jgi:hypothetical protein